MAYRHTTFGDATLQTTTIAPVHTISGNHPLTARPLTARLFQADCRDVLRSLDDNSIDSVVCDPPYALVSIVKRFGGANAAPAKGNDAYQRASAGFMGKSWGTGEVAFSDEFWAEVLRVLKPGGHVVAFSGTRTYHRMAVAIEDAGFEIRDQLAWCYGSGFPKSHDVEKAINKAAGVEFDSKPASGVGFMAADGPGGYNPTVNQLSQVGESTPDAIKWQGWGTALKPSWEPICLARKPLSEKTVAANVLRWGTGALNVDGCRVGAPEGKTSGGRGASSDAVGWQPSVGYDEADGRWPANLAHDGSDEVLAGFPETGAAKSGVRDPNGSMGYHGGASGTLAVAGHDDNGGSAARFFYSAKASRADRDEGLEAFKASARPTLGNGIGGQPDQQKANNRNTHPTVKPTALMQWLCRMVSPPGGTVLDPFMGSGSTGKAALRDGFDFIGCEREDEYMPIAKARVATGLRLAPKPVAKQPANDNQTADLFGFEPAQKTSGGGYSVMAQTDQRASSGGGIMAGKGGFGFRIREQRNKAARKDSRK